MSRARRQQYMLRTEASEQEAVITVCMECKKKFINWVKDEKRKAKNK